MVDCVMAFNRFIAALTGKPPKAPEPERYGSNLREAMADREKVVLVAECGGEFAGYATGGNAKGQGVIGTIFVREEHRRRGVGRDLVAAVAAWLRQQGCAGIRTEVLPQNPAAEFYRTLGFRREGKFMRTELPDPAVPVPGP